MSEQRLTTFVVGDLLLGLPVEVVEEVFQADHLTVVPLAPEGVAGLINLRGRILTAVDARTRLGLAPSGTSGGTHVVVTSGGEQSSLLVDRVADVVVVDEDDRDAVPETVDPVIRRLVTGAYQQEASLLLVLDPDLMLTF